MLNTELLLKVKAHILEEPRRLDMGQWLINSYKSPCGTAGCIAGWVCALSGTTENIRYTAKRLLNPTRDQHLDIACSGLFHSFPPSEFERGSKAYAEWVAREIDTFIETWGGSKC